MAHGIISRSILEQLCHVGQRILTIIAQETSFLVEDTTLALPSTVGKPDIADTHATLVELLVKVIEEWFIKFLTQ